MRLLSAVKAAAFVLAFTPLAATASTLTPQYGLLELGGPFLSYFSGTTGTATNVLTGSTPLTQIRLPVSSADLMGASLGTVTGTFVNFDGGGVTFQKGTDSLSLSDLHLNFITGQIDAIVAGTTGGTTTVLGRRNIFHTQLTPSIGQQIGLLTIGGTAAAPGPEFNFVTLLGQFGVSVGGGGVGTFTLVPEPGAIALFGLGAGLLGLARRRAK